MSQLTTVGKTISSYLLFALLAKSALSAPSAETMVQQGLDLRRAGRDTDALPKFEEAYKIERTPRTAAQWGLCLQAVSRWSEADPLLSEALSATKDPWVKKNRNVLKESQEAVKAHVGRIEVLGDPEGATVAISGRVVGTLPLAGAVTVNEGLVDLDVSSKGFKRTSRSVSVTGASYQRLVFHLIEDSANPVTSLPMVSQKNDAPVDSNPGLLTAQSDSGKAKSWSENPWIWAGLGATALAVVTAIVFATSRTTYPHIDDSRTLP